MDRGHGKRGRAWGAAVLMAAVAAAIAAPATGDSVAPPYSYVKPTPDGRYVFVMISPLEPSRDASSWIAEKAAKIEEIRKHYDRSGLYPNDNSTTPLWTVNWYSYGVEPLSDGVHLVRPGPWATSGNSEAVSFFANGTVIRSYAVRDLVLFPLLMPHTVSHFIWKRRSILHDDEKTYGIVTLHGDRYVFDVTTGRIISSRRPVLLALGALGFLVASTGAIALLRRWSGHPGADAARLLLKNLVFVMLVPGTVAGVVPALMSGGHASAGAAALLGAIVLFTAGAAAALWCIWDFAAFGRGTPAPIDAPKKLVTRGPYRIVRNPMYASVLLVLAGWTLLFQTVALASYLGACAAGFHLWVVFYEEPRLRRRFGAEYEQYGARVGRWLPRLRRRA